MTSKSQPKASDTTPDFEATLAELETIVSQMESGNLPLEQSMNAYKRGAELLLICQKALTDAEQQVRILTDANKLAAFNPGNE
ncbi:MAG TPA: exodeoxyribonuclease VII small subunit [Methylotenera sp.]|nr:exodeoxyribonuclease VII small subunit [Methylotenera sp.]HPV44064.1 exodeoxyribonuclease VII small subunit [Methylotenera sp.]